ncbi:PAAR domain-containing protein [Variovorax sp. LARHSF232]
MMRRFAAVGDALQNGGTIQPYSGPSFTFGEARHQAALIGGQAYCEACKSTGRIAKAGGPRRMNFMGEVALDGDVVLCRCARPQRIVATLAGDAYFEDMGGGEAAAESPESGPAAFAEVRKTSMSLSLHIRRKVPLPTTRTSLKPPMAGLCSVTLMNKGSCPASSRWPLVR